MFAICTVCQEIAGCAIQQDEKKALWLSIAKHVIGADKHAKRALNIINESDGALRIEVRGV
jgi:hypothetical protein